MQERRKLSAMQLEAFTAQVLGTDTNDKRTNSKTLLEYDLIIILLFWVNNGYFEIAIGSKQDSPSAWRHHTQRESLRHWQARTPYPLKQLDYERGITMPVHHDPNSEQALLAFKRHTYLAYFLRYYCNIGKKTMYILKTYKSKKPNFRLGFFFVNTR